MCFDGTENTFFTPFLSPFVPFFSPRFLTDQMRFFQTRVIIFCKPARNVQIDLSGDRAVLMPQAPGNGIHIHFGSSQQRYMGVAEEIQTFGFYSLSKPL